MTATNVSEAAGRRVYFNADGSPRPFPFWYCMVLVGLIGLFFPFLFSGLAERLFFKRAHLQRWTAVFSIGLVQLMRVALGWVAWKFAWAWLAWVIVLFLTRRVYKTALVWWAVIEGEQLQWVGMPGGSDATE
jgi:hypothetical protein